MSRGTSKATNFLIPFVANFSTKLESVSDSYEVKMRIGPEPVKKMPAFMAHAPFCGYKDVRHTPGFGSYLELRTEPIQNARSMSPYSIECVIQGFDLSFDGF